MSFEPNLSHTFMSKGSSYHITSHHIEHNFNFTVTWHKVYTYDRFNQIPHY